MKITNAKTLKESKIKAIIFGEPGTGKTTLAATVDQNELGRVLFISAEAGTLPLHGKDIDIVDLSVDEQNKNVPKEKRIQRLTEIYKYLLTDECKKKYSWIFIDSLTEISQNLMELLYTEFPERKDSLVMYGENSKRMRGIIKSFRDLPDYNIVFTALAEPDKDEVGQRFIGVSMIGKMSHYVAGFFDLVLYLCCQKQEDGTIKRLLITERTDKLVAKDRSGKLSRNEEPNLTAIVKKIRGVK